MAKRVSSNDASASKSKGARGKKTTTPAAMAPVEAVAPVAAAVAVEPSAPVVETAVVAAAAAPVAASATEVNEQSGNGHVAMASTTEQIARMAYFFWQERGCPVSTGVEDWLRAERELQQVHA